MRGLRAKQIRAHARIAAIGLPPSDYTAARGGSSMLHPYCQRALYHRLKASGTVADWPVGSIRNPASPQRAACRGAA